MPSKKSLSNLPSLLWNDDDGDHHGTITSHMATAKEFISVIAFATLSTSDGLWKTLSDRTSKGMKATFVVGTDFYRSSPDVLVKLLKLRPSENVRVLMGDWETKFPTFHPKVYAFKHKAKTTVIVGSANFTSGGLQGNHELSLLLEGDYSAMFDEISDWIEDQLETGQIIEATPATIADYRQAFDINKIEQALARKRVRQAIETSDGRIDVMRHLLEDMKADKSGNGFDAQVAKRKKDRVVGLAILKGLAKRDPMGKAEFTVQYRRFLKTLHSAGHTRSYSRLAPDYKQFREGVRVLLKATGGPRQLLDIAYREFEDVNRAGPNLITEILHSLDNDRFAVLNQNSVAGMKLCGFNGYPKRPNRKQVDASMYERFCDQANTLIAQFGLNNFSELDTLFNAHYWERRG